MPIRTIEPQAQVLPKTSTITRNSALELLRIISMILIIMHHYSVHGFGYDGANLTLNDFIVQVLSFGGKFGVNCFILITGYFMISSKFKIKKLVKIIFEVFTYSIVIFLVFCLIDKSNFSVKNLMQSLFPIIFTKYWFATTYVLLYIFSPYINMLVKTLDKKKHGILILTLVLIFSIIPTFATISGSPGFSNLAWFVTLYLIGGYIKLYPINAMKNVKKNALYTIIIFLLIVLSVIFIDILAKTKVSFASEETYFMDMNKVPMLLCSITMFLTFSNLNIKNNKVINGLALTMFGVYLIHDNPLVRHALWIDIFKNMEYINSRFLLIHATVAVLSVFVVCVAIDYIRITILEKPLFKLIDKKEKN